MNRVRKPSVRRSEYRAAAELRESLRRFLRMSERIMRAEGLTPERYELLLAVEDAATRGEGPTVRDLAKALQLSSSSVTQLVRRTQNAGLIRRDVSVTDGRVNFLHLTEEGERRLAGAVARLRGERRRLRAALGDQSVGARRP